LFLAQFVFLVAVAKVRGKDLMEDCNYSNYLCAALDRYCAINQGAEPGDCEINAITLLMNHLYELFQIKQGVASYLLGADRTTENFIPFTNIPGKLPSELTFFNNVYVLCADYREYIKKFPKDVIRIFADWLFYYTHVVLRPISSYWEQILIVHSQNAPNPIYVENLLLYQWSRQEDENPSPQELALVNFSLLQGKPKDSKEVDGKYKGYIKKCIKSFSEIQQNDFSLQGNKSGFL
jgi:hypothetical protein